MTAEAQASPNRALGAALVLGAAFLWATFGLFTKHLYAQGYTAIELASVRAAVGFAGAALIALARGPRRLAVPPRSLIFFAVYGILGFALFELIFFEVLDRTTVAIGVALLYTAPAFVLIFSRVVWKERVSTWKWLSLLLVLAGVILVTGAAGSGIETLPLHVLMLGLASGAAYAGYTLMSKRASMRFDSVTSLFWSFLFATIAFAILAEPISPMLRNPSHIPMLIALGIVPTLVPYGLYLMGMKYLRASTAAMIASVEPMIAAVMAAVVLGEALTGMRIAGIALIVTAAALLAKEESGSPAAE